MRRIETFGGATHPLTGGPGGSSGGEGGPAGEGALTPELAAGSWTFVSGHGPEGDVQPEPNAPITLEIQPDGRFAGSTGCNSLMGTMRVDEGAVGVGPVGQTMMACDDRLMKIERAYTQALDRVRAGSSSAGMMTLWGDGTVLRYGRAK